MYHQFRFFAVCLLWHYASAFLVCTHFKYFARLPAWLGSYQRVKNSTNILFFSTFYNFCSLSCVDTHRVLNVSKKIFYNALNYYFMKNISFTLEPFFVGFLFAFCLSPIPLVLLVTYIKSLGESKQVRHIVVMAVESEEESLVRFFQTKLNVLRKQGVTKNLPKRLHGHFKWYLQCNHAKMLDKITLH